MRLIDRFCTRFPGFGIPHLIRFIVFGTGLIYIFVHVAHNTTLVFWLFFSPIDIMNGQVWRLFSFIFVPVQDNPVWFAISMYVTYIFGTSLERLWGTAKFNLFILFNILTLAGAGMVAHFIDPFLAGATFIFVSGYFIQTFLIFAYITLAHDSTFNLYFVLPIRASLIGLIFGGALIYELFFGRDFPHFFPLNFLPFVLLIPYLLFCGESLFRHVGFSRPRNNSATVINFHRAKSKIEREQRAKPYTRKCEVCGKTDTDYPNMEFRYCSRCNGYHCFCMDHINDHTHVQ